MEDSELQNYPLNTDTLFNPDFIYLREICILLNITKDEIIKMEAKNVRLMLCKKYNINYGLYSSMLLIDIIKENNLITLAKLNKLINE